MARLLLIVLFVLGGLWLVNRVDLAPGGVGIRVDGSSVWREADQVEGHFVRSGLVEGVWMVFGGDAGGQRNSLAHATLAGLDLRYARSIAARYPDFHLCASPGAREAKDLSEHFSIVAANRSARDAVREAIELHARRLRSGGERTCLRVVGSHLDLEGVRLMEVQEDIPARVQEALRRVRYVLAEEAEVLDCAALLR